MYLGFGDVPPIRPLETLHNALSLRKLDSFLQDMILAQIFKTPTGSPPRVHDVPGATTTLAPGLGSADTMAVVSSCMVRPDHPPVASRRPQSADVEAETSSTSTGQRLPSIAGSEDVEDTNDEEMNKILASNKQRKFQKRNSVIGWRT